MAISATTGRLIRLNDTNAEISTLDAGDVRLECRDVPHELALTGDIATVRRHLSSLGYSDEAATTAAQEVVDFYTLGRDCLWIAVARGHLWWTFANTQIVWPAYELVLTGERVRKSVGGWQNTDCAGFPLNHGRFEHLLGKLRGGDASIDGETLQKVLLLINGGPAKKGTPVQSGLNAGTRGELEIPFVLHKVSDVLGSVSAAPNEPGVYAWWFDQLPGVPLAGTVEQGTFRLAYVGIASHRPGSKRTLLQRLRNHCNGPIATSTLRRSLAGILAKALDLHPYREGKKIKLPREEETQLSSWLERHGRVAWIADPAPWLWETEILKRGPCLPLNIQGNDHAFAKELSAMRRKLIEGIAVARASSDRMTDQ